MKKSVVCLITLISSLALTSMLAAQDAALVQAARKEGKVVWYTSLALPSSTAIAHFFEQKYKGITVEVHRTGSQRVLQRVMQEATAGIKNGDIIHTSDAGHFELLKAKNLLLKYTPQGVAPFPDGFKDKAGFYYGMRATLSVIAYNPKTVPDKDAPHPNAAKLFTEFIFAKESQQLLADKEGLYTGHPDVTYPSDKPKLKELKLLPADADELEKRNAEIKKRFVEYFGA